jgi:putative peptide maturation system protein
MMNDSLQKAVFDVLDYLLSLQQEGVRPQEARTRLPALRGRHPNLQIDLLAEEEAFDHSVHYDALLRCVGEGTVSLSYCPERAVPWPLRGVHRWNEGDLVRVNENILQVHAAIACLDFIWDEVQTIDRLVNLCLIHEELERQPIDLTDAELQESMDKFRAAKKLFTAEETLRWLERHGMTHETLERYVAETAIVPKLRDRIATGQVEAYFSQHQSDFDTAWVARLEVADESQAHELAEQICTGAQDFCAAAERLFFEAAERGAPSPAMFATIDRRQAEPALRDPLFAATLGQWIGPVPVETGYVLMRVLAVVPAQLNDRTRAVIKDILFQVWLNKRRQASRIEWCWGNASKTSEQTEDDKDAITQSTSTPP